MGDAHVLLEFARLQANYWEEAQRGTPMSVHERYRKSLDRLRPRARATKLPRPLGVLLLERELVTREQLSAGLVVQRAGQSGRLLGEILVAQGVLAPQDIVDVLERVLGAELREQIPA